MQKNISKKKNCKYSILSAFQYPTGLLSSVIIHYLLSHQPTNVAFMHVYYKKRGKRSACMQKRIMTMTHPYACTFETKTTIIIKPNIELMVGELEAQNCGDDI